MDTDKLLLINNDFDIVHDWVNKKKAEKEFLIKSRSEKMDSIKLLEGDIELYKKCLLLLDFYTSDFLKAITFDYAQLVTKALKMLADDYEFKIEFDTTNKRPACKFLLKSKEFNEWHDPNESHGDGIIDVVGLAAYLVTIKLFGGVGFICLDEPLRGLDRLKNSERMSDFINAFADTGIQLVMTTHNEKFGSGKIFKLDRENKIEESVNEN